MNRRSSVYTIEFPSMTSAELSTLISENPSLPVGSSTRGDSALLQIREKDDVHAIARAGAIAGERAYVVRTGYGISRRYISDIQYSGRPCWACLRPNTVVRPDPAMGGLTDEIVCVDCLEVQEG